MSFARLPMSLVTLTLCLAGCATDGASKPASTAATAEASPWITLFNGRDLDGWTPKIVGHPLGENFANTFRVENGVLKVSYDGYDLPFADRFGHLFYKTPYSHYVLRIEYRFVGEQVAGGPGWALRNSGVMLHCQKPETMGLTQSFPVSIEAQFLGGNGQDARSTNNLCTPGTHVVLNGKLHKEHCANSASKTFHGEQWVTAELEVHGAGAIVHRVNGEEVMRYEQAQLDEQDADAQRLMAAGAQRMVAGGYIALQAESHPIEFRRVELLPLPENF